MKKKRAKRRARYRATKPAGVFPKGIAATSQPSKTIVTAAAGTATLSQAQKEQHKYLLPELRQIGIIAASLFLILIILSFILG